MRIIIHIDLDAFFAAVEVRERPELRGKPVVVGADPKGGRGRGVVSTASYEARKFGIRSGMPISIAWRKCRQCVFLPVDYEKYAAVSERVMEIARKYADKFEQVSIDEAYLDVSSSGSYERAIELARALRREVEEREGLSCSIGIGPNKLVAKIASDYRKPKGLTVVKPAAVLRFLTPLGVRSLVGVGPKTEAVLDRMGIRTIGQLREVDEATLVDRFGKFGRDLWAMARGIDEREVEERWIRKSMGREHTFERDTDDATLLGQTLDALARDVHASLLAEGLAFRTVTVKVRYAWFETHTHARTLRKPSTSLETMRRLGRELLQPFLAGEKIRLVGLRLSGLEEAEKH